MIRKKREGVEWLEFELLQDVPGLIHGISLRQEGCIRQALQIPRTHSGVQVHGNQIALVTDGAQAPQQCDGLITQKSDLGLVIYHADCQAALFYDPIHRALAAVHCGWRGNVQNIYAEAIGKMAHTFGSKPENLLVGVSPSLGPDHSEFINYKVELPEEFWQFQTRPLYFDLWAIARYQLEKCGILSHHLQIAELCTYANSEDFFSYRRDKVTGPVGRHNLVAMLSALP